MFAMITEFESFIQSKTSETFAAGFSWFPFQRGVGNSEVFDRRKVIVIFVSLKAFTVMYNLSCMRCRRLLGVQEHRN